MNRQKFVFFIKISLIILVSLLLILYLLNRRNALQNSDNNHITLEDIFNHNLSAVGNIPQGKIVTVVSTGDISLAGEINDLSINRYKNFIWPFQKIASLLRQADISIVNLESLLFPGCVSSSPKYYILCGNSKFIDGLAYAGIDVVNVANNHIIDYGKETALEEIKLLKKAGFVVSGVDGDSFMNVKNIKVGFLGFNDIKYNYIEYAKEKEAETLTYQSDDISNLVSLIKLMKQKSDIVIVSFHWGREYTDIVTERQRYLAHTAIDSGADLVLGNHPHWIQPIEVYRDKLIVYSHGSLVFNQKNFELANNSSEQTKIGLVGKYYFSDNRIIGVEFIPIKIDDNKPNLMDEEDKQKILRVLAEKSFQSE